MSDARSITTTQFLTVAEAAARLGQSRLRVREAAARGVLVSRRDNEGRLRVDVPEGARLDEGWPEGGTLEPDALVGFLFDEIEELKEAESEQAALIATLSGLVERQGTALDKADAALTEGAAKQARLSGMLDRALGHLETQTARAEGFADLSGRTLARLEETGAAFEQSEAQKARLEALLDRAMALGERSGGAGQAAERAFDLLDQALGRAEAEQASAARTGDLLGRAMAATEQAEAEIARQKDRIETALSLSERAVAAAKPRVRRGFWDWLTGR